MSTRNSCGLVVKDKLPPQSGSATLRELNHIHKIGAITFFQKRLFLKQYKCNNMITKNESLKPKTSDLLFQQ